MSTDNSIIGRALSLVVAHGDNAGAALWKRIGKMSNLYQRSLLSRAAAVDAGVP